MATTTQDVPIDLRLRLALVTGSIAVDNSPWGFAALERKQQEDLRVLGQRRATSVMLRFGGLKRPPWLVSPFASGYPERKPRFSCAPERVASTSTNRARPLGCECNREDHDPHDRVTKQKYSCLPHPWGGGVGPPPGSSASLLRMNKHS